MKSRLKVAVGLAVTVFFLWWALQEVEWSEVWTNMRNADYLLLGIAVVISTLGMNIRAMRWKALLTPVRADVPFHPRVAGTYVGFAANNVLPARVGEFARALVCARTAGLPVSAVFASLVVERVLDGLVMVAFLFGAMAWPGFPGRKVGEMDPRTAAIILTVMAVGASLVLLGMALYPNRAVSLAEKAARILPTSFRRPLVDALRAFLGGLGVLRSPRLLLISVGWALFQWLFLATSYVFAFRAFGITEPGFLGAVFLQSIIALAVSIPSGPGFFGVFEAGAVAGLALWGVEKDRAVSFAFGLHLGGWISVTVIGIWYLWRLGLSWRELRGSEEKVEEAVEKDPAMPGPEREVR
jgi:uncharacterized protein (TIRG00374 family)